jgi:hypothetical protein
MLAGLRRAQGGIPLDENSFQSGVPVEQIGWEHPFGPGSVLTDTNHAPPRSFTTNPAPLALGQLPDENEQFVQGNADYGILPGWELPDPQGPWNHLWNEDWLKEENLAHQHKMMMEGDAGLADMLQHTTSFATYGNQPAPYYSNLEQPGGPAFAVPVYSTLGM